MSTERTLHSVEDKKAMNNLIAVVAIFNTTSDKIVYTVEDCYFDIGQNWMWTTIIAHKDNSDSVLSSYQAVNSKEWKLITEAKDTMELLEVAKSLIKK